MKRSVAAAVLACLFAASACGEEEEVAEAPPSVAREDAVRLLAAFGGEEIDAALSEVDALVADDRPVLASEILADRALPAVTRQLAAVDAVAITTEAGHAAKARLRAALAARRDALAAYRDALARGVVEDVQLLSAIHAQRLADERLAEAHRALLTEASQAR